MLWWCASTRSSIFISIGGMVQRTSVRGISRYGRASQGVRLMNLKDDDIVSAVALVVDDGGDGESGDGTGENEQPEPLDAAADDLHGDPGENGNSPLA